MVLTRLAAAVCGPWGVTVLVLAVTAVRLALLSSGLAPPVMPAEAGFWLLGEAPRPVWPETGPLLPWLLALLSDTCGADAPCLRLWGPVAHGVTMWFVYRLGVRLFDPPTGFWCALLYASLPLVLQGGLVVGPMALVLPLWTVGLLALARTHAGRGLADWVAMGACVGLGLLAHPVMALFMPLALLYLLTSPDHRGVWRRGGPYVAVLVAGLCLLPVLPGADADGWQALHRLLAALSTPPGDPSALVLSELGPTVAWGAVLGGPVLALVLVWLVVRVPVMLARDGGWADYRVRLLLLFSLPVLAVTLGLTLLLRNEGAMLTAPAVPAALVMVCGWLMVQGRLRWLVGALAVNGLLLGALLAGPDAARREGWVVPAVLDITTPGQGYDVAGRWLDALAASYPDTPLGVAGEDAPLLSHRAAVLGLAVPVVDGAEATGTDGGAFTGLLVMPAVLAEAGGPDGTDTDIRARLSVSLPDGRVLNWAAVMVP
jgi:4-amino-4-deoxy-L-arabinose transferase-like glycosyltransferase